MHSKAISTLHTKLTTMALLLVALAANGLAQSGKDYNRIEVYGGYSLARGKSNVEQLNATSPGGTETFSDLCSSSTGERLGPNSQKFFCERRNFHGFDGSFTLNFSRYFGVIVGPGKGQCADKMRTVGRGGFDHAIVNEAHCGAKILRWPCPARGPAYAA